MNNGSYALAVLLLCASSTLAQFPPSQAPPPYINPKTFPPDIAAPTSAPTPEKTSRPLTADAVKRAVETGLRKQAGLASGNIKVNVTEHAVVLYGSVPADKDDIAARRIAEYYAGERHVEDNLQIGAVSQ